MDFDFIRFDWPNMSFIAALAIIPIAVAIATPMHSLSHQQVSAVVMTMPADEPIIID